MSLYNLLISLGGGLGVAILTMSAVFVVAEYLKRYDLVDVGWGLTFIAIGGSTFYINQSTSLASRLVLGLVLVWGLRLSLHILKRFLRSNSEDRRYIELRKNWSKSNMSLQAYMKIFVLQAVLATFVMTPVILVMTSDVSANKLVLLLAVAIWLKGFFFESIGDFQLGKFSKDKANKGQVMTKGLWKYTRHPNYFGEITQWWAIGIIALTQTYGYIGLIGPALITYLIVFVSGVPMAEKMAESRKGWNKYKASTSPLIPWLPKN